MNPKNEEIRVKANWRPTGGEPSPAWVRLWRKLLTSRKEKSANARQDSDNGECKDGNGRNISHQ